MTRFSVTLSDTGGVVSFALGDRQSFLKAVAILAEALEMPLDDLLTTIKERAHERSSN